MIRPIRSTLVAGLLAVIFLAAGMIAAGSFTPAQAETQAQAEDPVQLGGRLYAENCAVCHGDNGQGRVGATLAKNWPSIRPDLTVRNIIVNGVPGSPMPAWSQAKGGPFTDGEIDALTQYILAWQTGGAPQITPRPTATLRTPITPVPNVQGDPNSGAVLYEQNCVMCHGSNGEGRIGATLAKAWPGIRPDLSVRTTIANGVPGGPMVAWSQAQGGPLTEQEIDNLTAYVLTLNSQQVVEMVQTTPGVVPNMAPTQPGDPMTGWGAVIVFVALLAGIVGLVLWLQRRK